VSRARLDQPRTPSRLIRLHPFRWASVFWAEAGVEMKDQAAKAATAVPVIEERTRLLPEGDVGVCPR